VPPVEDCVTVGAVVGDATGTPVTPDVDVREALKVEHVMFPVPLDVQPKGRPPLILLRGIPVIVTGDEYVFGEIPPFRTTS